MAFARKSGEVGVATVPCGPGLTQVMTALPAAVRARLPLVIFAGEAPLKSGWCNQAIDQAPFVKATGAAYHSLHWPERMPSRRYERFLTIREYGAIGNGISFAMGVAAARPDSTVVLFDGDGSLLMHVQELETIKRHGLNILIVVLNDGAYGSEVQKLRAEGLAESGAVFGRADLAAIASGFGLGGETVHDLSALPKLNARFSAAGGAAVWDVPVSDRVVSPVIRRAHPQKPARGDTA
jgi:thiamine pyrophosphate-dependent acetolactate synthase large subunit-like protein